MGKIFAVVVVLFTAVSTAIFVMRVWWLPVDISTVGPAIDHQLNDTMVGTGVLFVFSQILLAFFVWGSSSRSSGTKRFPGGAASLVVFAIVVVGIEILALALVGTKAWAAAYLTPADTNALKIEVQAEQFAFHFRYPGADGRFGAVHADKIDDSSGNYFGLDPEHDAAARDDIVVNSLTIPVNQAVALNLRSKDVGHSFFVRELRVQQDFVPGLDIPLHFTATKTGKYEIVCTQLCGLGHYRMKAYLSVLSQDDYDRWLKAREIQ